MALIRTWSGDELQAGPITSGPDDTPFSGTQGSPTVVDGGPRTPRIAIPDAAGPHNVRWWPLPGAPLTSLAIRCYVTFTGFPSEAHVFRAAASGSERWSVRVRTGGHFAIHSDGAWRWQGQAGSVPADGSPVRVEAVADGPTVTVTVYAGDTMTVLDSGATSAALSGADEVWFGKAASGQASAGMTFDDLAVADVAALIGPSVPPLPATNVYVSVAGTLRPAAPHLRVGGAWRPAVTH